MNKMIVDVDYVLRQINKGSEKWIKVEPFDTKEEYCESFLQEENNYLQKQKQFLIDMIEHLCENIQKLPKEAHDLIPKHRKECDCKCHQGVDILHFLPCCDRGPGESATVYITERDVIDE